MQYLFCLLCIWKNKFIHPHSSFHNVPAQCSALMAHSQHIRKYINILPRKPRLLEYLSNPNPALICKNIRTPISSNSHFNVQSKQPNYQTTGIFGTQHKNLESCQAVKTVQLQNYRRFGCIRPKS